MSRDIIPLAGDLIPFADNPAPRCPTTLLLDRSSSMHGGPIDELNAGLERFARDIQSSNSILTRVEIQIIAFGDRVEVIQPFTCAMDFTAPRLSANGATPMGEALLLSERTTRERQAAYQKADNAAYPAMTFLFTDGAPTDRWQQGADKLHAMVEQGALRLFGIGIGPNADMATLARVCHPGTPPLRLQDLRFDEFFRFLRDSLEAITHSQPGDRVQLPSPAGWAEL